MAVQYIILLSRQGKVRLAKWFLTLSLKEKSKIVKDVSTLVLGRRTKMCSFLEYKDSKVVYRRYASLFFIAGIESTDNELITLEIVHRYVEQMDRYYGNVCELDIIFNFQKAYYILDELLIAGELQESSKRDVLRRISQQDSLEEAEGDEEKFSRLMPYIGQLPGMSGDGSSSLGSGSGAGGMSSSGGPGGSFASARGRSGASRIGQSKSGYNISSSIPTYFLLTSHRPRLRVLTATIPDSKSQATSPTSAVDTVRASLLSRYSSATSLPGLASFSSVDANPQLTTLRSLYLSPHTALAHTVQREDGTITYTPGANAYPPVRLLNPIEKQRILVTGGAGFVGSHLVDRLMLMGHNVICLDNFFTGSKSNVAHWIGHPNFELIRHDVVDPILVEVDQIYHLACPASPVHYQSNPVKTLKTGFFGTYNMLGLAKRVKARFLLSSTSEIYGDPEEHPQKESYWGHVNCTGPRACYDEGKRVAETLAYSYQRQEGVDVRVARIFNTFGPRMNWNDGRVVSNFILQALKSEDLTVYGDGKSTRSFQYVHDLVDGLMKLMNSNCDEPVNIGTQEEFTIDQFAQMVIDLVAEETGHCGSQVVHMAALEDDPQKRKPDTTRAKQRLDWEPQWKVIDGLRETVKYFKTTQVDSEI